MFFSIEERYAHYTTVPITSNYDLIDPMVTAIPISEYNFSNSLRCLVDVLMAMLMFL